MQVIASGSPRARFTMTPRHEAQRLNGLAPELPRRVVATFRAGGMNGLGAPFPPVATGAYMLLVGLFLGALGGRR